jgi:diamine N-acetyltransferase
MEEILENKNIRLRALEKNDLDYLYKWENDTAVWNLSDTLIPFSRFTLEQYIEAARQDIYEAKQLRLIIEHKETGKALGTVDLFDFDPFHARAGIGILIAEKDDRKKGYASEALDIHLNYCTNILNLKQVYCNILENNENSMKLFISKGFIITGGKKDWIKKGDEWLTQYFLQKILR